MYKSIILSLAFFTCCLSWAQGSGSNDPNAPHGPATGMFTPPPAGFGVPVSEAAFMAQCMGNLSAFASQKLQAQLLKEKAVTSQVLASAKVNDSALGASCSNACAQYAKISHMISWAHVSPGFLSEPEHSQQVAYKLIPQPALPGSAEVDNCMPKAVIVNWCPPQGLGIGAGNLRIENPLDHIAVCSTNADALQNMNFSQADIARNCAKPAITDAAVRVKAEQNCIADSIKAEKKTADDKIAANKAAAVYTGPPLSAKPAGGGVMSTQRNKP